MNHSLYAAFLFNFHWNHETLTTDGNEFILKSAAFGELAQVAAQRFLDQALLLFDFAADAAQFRRCTVVEGAIGKNFVAKRFQEVSEVGDTAWTALGIVEAAGLLLGLPLAALGAGIAIRWWIPRERWVPPEFSVAGRQNRALRVEDRQLGRERRTDAGRVNS